MDLKKPLAALALVGTVALGGAGLAGAQEATPDTGTPSGQFTITVDCGKATDRLHQAEARVQKAHDRIGELTTRRDTLQDEGKTQRADRLTKLIDRANDRVGRVETRLQHLEGELSQHCPA
jgi:hypothetical protein